jgi:DeoR/GlpR family transcriptional regulator of sugar metabolism
MRTGEGQRLMTDTEENASKHRLKQKDLIALLLTLFSEEYDKAQVDSITDILLPMGAIKTYLQRRVGISYTSDAWIITQVRKYEEEIGTTLFRKAVSQEGAALGLSQNITTYEQKRHLYISQKIRTANGVFDLIRNSVEKLPSGDTVSLLLEAGSTVTRVAEIIAQNLHLLPLKWDICTHNLGVIECLGKTSPAYRNVSISVPQGKFDPVTHLILSDRLELYLDRKFDWIIQGTSFLADGKLYVEKPDEARLKAKILSECKGKKVLVLTGHEATSHLPSPAEPFGAVSDYDYIVYPAMDSGSAAAKRMDREMAPFADTLPVMIRNWSYVIMAHS